MGLTKKISDDLNISKATISRALNNCRGIDYATKEKIVQAALKYGYRRYVNVNADVGIVMPCVPSSFWGKFGGYVHDGIKDLDLNAVSFLCSSLHVEADALNCIDRAIESGVSVMIVSAPDTERIKNKLSECADKMLIILLEEYLDVVNTFYVGDDSYQSGYNLASAYRKKYPETTSFAIIRNLPRTVTQRRIEGFCDALGDCKIKYIDGPFEKKIMSSLIARELSLIEDKIDCVFCPDGMMEQTGSAVYKLRSENDIHCIGFESSKGCRKYIESGIIKAVASQDTKAQAETAVLLAEEYIRGFEYPKSKCCYVKSKIDVY